MARRLRSQERELPAEPTATRPVLIGVVLGLASSTVVMRFVASKMCGVGALDAYAYGTAAGVLIVAALAATTVPTLKACRVDPITALRQE